MNTNPATMTVTDFCGVPGSVPELKNSWFSIAHDRLFDHAIISGCPSDFAETLVQYVRENKLPLSVANDYESFVSEMQAFVLAVILDAVEKKFSASIAAAIGGWLNSSDDDLYADEEQYVENILSCLESGVA